MRREAVARDGTRAAASVAELVERLERGDTIDDGGNSYYVDDLRRAKEFATPGLHYVDAGVSGGVFGLERGYCQMIGGEREVVERLEPGNANQEHAPRRRRSETRSTIASTSMSARSPSCGVAAASSVRGSVISSWLLDRTAAALLGSADLARYAGRVSDSGEGRWTIKAAIDEAVPAPVLTAALYERAAVKLPSMRLRATHAEAARRSMRERGWCN